MTQTRQRIALSFMPGLLLEGAVIGCGLYYHRLWIFVMGLAGSTVVYTMMCRAVNKYGK